MAPMRGDADRCRRSRTLTLSQNHGQVGSANERRIIDSVVLPEGKVIFLLTDVEGSTRRWDEQPERMRELLERHDQLLTSEIRRHAGVVVKSKGEGDSLFAVFKEAR